MSTKPFALDGTTNVIGINALSVKASDEKVNYQRPSFMDKFLELQAVMWRTNAGLTDRHAYDSRPNHWPWLRRGIVGQTTLDPVVTNH